MNGSRSRRLVGVFAGAALVALLLPVPASAQPQEMLVFTTQPGGGAAGTPWAQQPVVKVLNELNQQVVTSDNSTVVYLTISANPAAGTLTCAGNTYETVTNGVAAFSGCSINTASTNPYSLYATSSAGFTPATSAGFYITGGSGGTSNHLVFQTAPSSGTPGTPFSVVVYVENASNALVSDTSSITLTLEGGTGAGGLVCTPTNPVQAVGGVASFSCYVQLGSTNPYYLYATSSSGWNPATSAGFLIGAGANHLVFQTAPSSGTPGTPFSVVVYVENASNALVSDTSSITLTLEGGTGAGGLVCTPTNPVQAVGGVASFSCYVQQGSTNPYYLYATSSSGWTPATSAGFLIGAGANHLVFQTAPSSGTPGTPFSVVVYVENASNALVSDTSSITLTLEGGTGAGGLVCTPTNPVQAVGGVASFSCYVQQGSTNPYYLYATSSSGWTPATSAGFLIGAGANHLVFQTAPSSGTPGTPFSVVVYVENASNALVSDTSSITLTLEGGTGAGGLVCTPTNPVQAVGGVASFSCYVQQGSTNPYYLYATSSSGWTPATSAGFLIGAGANHLVFQTAPSSGTPGTPFSVVVYVENASNALVSDTSSITLTLEGGTGAGGLVCTPTNPVQAVGGVASFSCYVQQGSTNPYYLYATSSSGWTPATSSSFLIGATTEQLVFVTPPGGGAAGAVWSQQPVVAVEYNTGGVVSTDNSTVVYLAIATNPGSAARFPARAALTICVSPTATPTSAAARSARAPRRATTRSRPPAARRGHRPRAARSTSRAD